MDFSPVSLKVWGVVTAHSKEVDQVVAVCGWVSSRFGGNIVLLGNSAGAPFAGSAVDRVSSVRGIVLVGYTFGWIASIAFSGHFQRILSSSKPKLFIMGDTDEFTTVSQLRAMVRKCRGSVNDIQIFDGVSHFQLESPAFDSDIASHVSKWLAKIDLL